MSPAAAASTHAPPPHRGFDPREYHDPRPAPALIHALGLLNRFVVLPHVLRLRALDFPSADLARLRAALQPGTAAFLAPVHPEFMTDWMLDKEVSRRAAPLMAHWASYEIVNAGRLQRAFWLRNNLIANAPGGGGKERSVCWALAGHGVLLHPEGSVSWHGGRVDPLVPGIVELAWDACRRAREAGTEKPVFVVPLVWKLRFVRDVSAGLAREMAHIERRLALPAGDALPVERRFAALQRHLLQRRCERLGLPAPPAPGDAGYFAAQGDVVREIRRRLEERHGPLDGDFNRVQHGLRRALRELRAADPEGARRDRALLDEWERLERFPADLYGASTLAQEEVAENLKRTRAALVTRGFGDALHNAVPVAVGPRVAHLRVPEPLAVHEAFTADPRLVQARRAGLLSTLRRRMQDALDALGTELATPGDRWRMSNPLAAQPPAP
ncbi:MAG: hypothetical protein HZC42_14815 [Candidatus Eisenbacteria bacterium]|nr:hypothetical protein [Candidatus Eisenbacteria bacterium]